MKISRKNLMKRYVHVYRDKARIIFTTEKDNRYIVQGHLFRSVSNLYDLKMYTDEIRGDTHHTFIIKLENTQDLTYADFMDLEYLLDGLRDWHANNTIKLIPIKQWKKTWQNW